MIKLDKETKLRGERIALLRRIDRFRDIQILLELRIGYIFIKAQQRHRNHQTRTRPLPVDRAPGPKPAPNCDADHRCAAPVFV